MATLILVRVEIGGDALLYSVAAYNALNIDEAFTDKHSVVIAKGRTFYFDLNDHGHFISVTC